MSVKIYKNPSDIIIDPTAIIDSNVLVGEGTKVWHFTHIMSGANIGKNCTIGQNVFIGKNVKIGDGCKIQNNAYIPEGVLIMDEVFIGPSVVFTNVRRPRAFYKAGEFEKTVVESQVTIGANSTIRCGVQIHFNAFIGAGSIITREVPEGLEVKGLW